jgi:hydroxymethylpyrimidine pyrophosphatase-like HAD family hydrolase
VNNISLSDSEKCAAYSSQLTIWLIKPYYPTTFRLEANSVTIRLIVFDIDGVLTEGEAQPLDLPLLDQLRQMNHLARADATQPAVTLCTGRPAPYLEVMLQAIDAHLPGIFENGAGLYVPETYRFLPHPDISDITTMQRVQQRLAETLVKSGLAYFQPGKIYTLTLFATDPAATGKLAEATAVALGSLAEAVELVYSFSCLNILPREIHKGKGITFLADQVGIAPENMLGVGDSDVDLPFLQTVGYAAAPSNANTAVKQLAHYISPYPTSAGVRDILRHFGLSVS